LNPRPENHKALISQGLTETPSPDSVHALDQTVQKDPRLTVLIDRWNDLPERVRMGIAVLAGIDDDATEETHHPEDKP
jgi:hypothetical protein